MSMSNQPEVAPNQNIAAIAKRLVENFDNPTNANLTQKEIEEICSECKKILLTGLTVLDVYSPVIIVGDVHGQFQDLVRIFKEIGTFEESTKKYLFMGDYVDRGQHSIETITLLLAYKCVYKDRITLLRGNHETRLVNTEYGFRREIKERGFPDSIWEQYNTVFDCLPLCAFVLSKHTRIFCTHGGLSEALQSTFVMADLRKVQRPIDVPDHGAFCDLLWADPVSDVKGFVSNNRGISVYFGKDTIEEFCAAHKINFIARAHQVKDRGYEWFSPNLLTIFSAPNYAGEYDNTAAVLAVELRSYKIIQLPK